MKERYLSKTTNVTFVYLSKCNVKLPGIFGNPKKRFLWTGLLYTVYHIYMLFWTGDHHGCGFTIGGEGRDLQWLNCTNQCWMDSAVLFPRKLGRDYEIRPNFASRPQTRTRSFIDIPTFFLLILHWDLNWDAHFYWHSNNVRLQISDTA